MEDELGTELHPKGDLKNWYAWFAFSVCLGCWSCHYFYDIGYSYSGNLNGYGACWYRWPFSGAHNISRTVAESSLWRGMPCKIGRNMRKEKPKDYWRGGIVR